MLHRALESLPDGRPRLVLAIGGGDGSLEAEVIARHRNRDVFYCGVDRDSRAVAENQRVLRIHGLEKRGTTVVGSVAGNGDVAALLERAAAQFHVRFEGVSICVCQGIVEYFDLHSQTNQSLLRMLRAVLASAAPGGQLLISQTGYHDRVRYLERGLQWHMRLREPEELSSVVRDAGWSVSICQREPMGLITMCLAERVNQCGA